MSSSSFLFFFFFFLLVIVTNALDSDQEREIFIVRVSNLTIPSSYSRVEYYEDILRSSNIELLDSTTQQTIIVHVYEHVLQGFAAWLSTGEVAAIEEHKDVLSVFRNDLRHLHTTHSQKFLGLVGGPLWNSSHLGSDVVIGLLDTGVWPEKSSFNDHGLNSVPLHWKGECNGGHLFPGCNKKIIGANFFANGVAVQQPSARDTHGHGTHTASIAAGGWVSDASIFGFAQGVAYGSAPKARIATYKVCWPRCSIVDIVAAYDRAVRDKVDIISFSVGGGAGHYHEDPVAIAQFGAMANNILVSASAGNQGPLPGSVSNISPWIVTVGAGTTDRRFPAKLVTADGDSISGQAIFSGPPLLEKKFHPLYFAGNGGEGAFCAPGKLDRKHVVGKIVVCMIGEVPRVLQGEAVKKSGGVGMVLANLQRGESSDLDAYNLPTIVMSASAADKVFSYMQSSNDPRATIISYGTELNSKPAPMVAHFSSRGPNPVSANIMKPDVVAPGVSILAAWPNIASPSMLPFDTRQVGFNVLSGTSMSCPHVSGVAALLKGAHPDWSPSRIKSAIMTTAYVVDNVGSHLRDESTNRVSTVWAYGSGHVDPEKANNPGLVYDLKVEDYIDFLCASKYSKREIAIIAHRNINCKPGLMPWNINYPSVAVSFTLSGAPRYQISVERVVTNVGQPVSKYNVRIEHPVGAFVTVEPLTLDFVKQEEKISYTINISADTVDLPYGESNTIFGSVTWYNEVHDVRLPVAVTFSDF